MSALLAWALGALLVLAPGAYAAESHAGSSSSPVPPSLANRVIVQWDADADRGDRLAARADAEVTAGRKLGDPDFQLVKVEPGQDVADAVEALASDPAVVVAERDSYRTLQGVPNDPLFGQLWGLRNLGGALGVGGVTGPLAGADIDVLGAWVRTVGTPATTVAVIDSGYRFTHPDLAPVAWTNTDEVAGDSIDNDLNGYVDDRRGYDFVGNNYDSQAPDSDPNDDNVTSGGHGTHVAGTIGAKGDNGVGITGVAQDVRIMPLRVCAHSVTFSGTRCAVSAEIEAILYANDNGARVANMSLGGTNFSQAEVNALAASPETLYVISAGNDAENNETNHHYPCDYRPTVEAVPPGTVDNVVCVAATDQADELASFSDWGATSVDLAAPGTEVLSAYPTSNRFNETFTANDFASKWSATGTQGFDRSDDAPLTSFGMTDSDGSAPAASTIYESTLTTGFAIPPGVGSCTLSGMRFLSLGTGGSFSYTVLRNDVNVFTSSPGSTPGSVPIRFFTVPIAGLAGGTVKLRFRFTSGSAPTASNGAWLDDVKVDCYDSPTSAVATFELLAGTSMAAPHVAGVAGLLFSQRPAATVVQVRDALLDSVDPVIGLDGLVATGGRLNASQALDEFDDQAPAAPQLASTPASPADNNAPKVRGTAEELSTVRLYSGTGCGGAPLATASAASFASLGIAVSVPDNSTRTFSATATDTADNGSPCSVTFSYVEKTLRR